ncbi:MAG: SprT family zinc-dependent metalloprotease [Immundisolibacter sp.]
MSEHLRFELADGAVTCRVVRARRRTYALRVTADGTLELRVPQRLPARLYPQLLTRHRRWIARQFERLAQLPPPADFGPGGRQRYLGQWYPLQLGAGRRQVTLAADGFRVQVAQPQQPQAVALALDAWYRAQARLLLPARLQQLARQLPWLDGRMLSPPRLLRLRRRWGSCRADGRITLNIGLVLLSPPLIDYVLLHELCHLRELNHGPRFYQLLAAVLPDHRQRQSLLRDERPWQPMAGGAEASVG